MECTTGVRTAPMGAGWIWDTLADSACSHHIPSLAPAVALPAPRHDRRRTGAAGSPPGGFPFVELTSRGCEMRRGCALEPQSCAPQSQALATNFVHFRGSGNPRLRVPGERSETGTSGTDLWPWVPATHSASQTRVNVLLLSRGPRCGDERSGEAHRANWDPSTGVLLDTGNSLCYRTQPLRGLRGRHSGRIAQLVEQLTLNQRVPGSSPGAPTKKPNKLGLF